MRQVTIPPNSALVGQELREICREKCIKLIIMYDRDTVCRPK